MPKGFFQPATLRDIETLVVYMRPSDISECHRMARYMGRECNIAIELSMTYVTQQVWSLWLEGELLGCCGVTDLGEGKGAIWFLGTSAADNHPVALTRSLRDWAKVQARSWEWLGNWIPQDMVCRAAWLHKIGFDMAPLSEEYPDKPRLFWWRQHGPTEGSAAP